MALSPLRPVIALSAKQSTWFKIQGQQVHLRILVKPHAKKTAILGVREHRLQIAIHAKPHEGEANKALMVYLATG